MTSRALAHRLTDRIGPERSRVLLQFGRFGVVGTIGFVVDTVVLYLALAGGSACIPAAPSPTWRRRPRPGG